MRISRTGGRSAAEASSVKGFVAFDGDEDPIVYSLHSFTSLFSIDAVSGFVTTDSSVSLTTDCVSRSFCCVC